MTCLDDETVAAFVLGDLPQARRVQVEAHLAGCASCTTLVAEYGKFFFQTHVSSAGSDAGAVWTPPSASDPGAEGASLLGKDTAVSRYVVARLLGRGGAGDVYEAWDPRLKRKVALKLLRPLAAEGVAPSEAEARLLREAESMARLAHPNVVAVHDAGTFDGRVFIVMELVEGETLARWLRAAPRAPDAVLDVFLAAGRGLDAAHAAGLVHRDFKPENVLVGNDGRARVTDFGLARADASRAAGIGAGAIAPGGATIAGGTPLYMAPEQHRAEPATAASDQWSFCLALYRALTGRDPFGLPARQAWAEGRAVAAAAPALDLPPEMPSALQAALVRGLTVDPSRRFVSMGSLLDALEGARAPALVARRAPRSLARRATILAAAAAAVILTGALAFRALRPTALDPRCGNRVVESGEECDDGSTTCTPGCLRCDGGDARFYWPQTGACYERIDRAVTWDQAAAACGDRGGALVSYGTATEAAAVADALLAGNVEAWMGLRRDQVQGFLWSSGEAWADPLPIFWNNVAKPPGHDCVAQRSATADVRFRIGAVWPTARCEERRAFVCERLPWRRDPTSGHAYRVFPHKIGWREADQICRKVGTRLAELTTAAEHAFVTSFTNLPVWIGALTRAKGGPLVWSSGAPFGFNVMAPNEPDQPTRACLVLGVDDLWHDRNCHDPNAFVCEAE